jgi:hypothetical protein
VYFDVDRAHVLIAYVDGGVRHSPNPDVWAILDVAIGASHAKHTRIGRQ